MIVKRLGKIFLLIMFVLSNVHSQDKTKILMEEEILKEINFARTNPKGYLEILKGLKKYYFGKELRLPGKTRLITYEGVAALNEAIIFVSKQPPLSPLKSSRGLDKAARMLAEDQKKTGSTGHIGSDGKDFSFRMEKFGKWSGSIAENIGYGSDEARSIVYQLIIDDGVKARGHRKNLFGPDFRLVGLAFDKHPKWRTICVMDFAVGFEENDK